MMEILIELLQSNGLPTVVIAFLGYLFYKYIMIRLDHMRLELMKELEDKKYNIVGRLEYNEELKLHEFTMDILQTTVKKIK